jgi:hypothetical protein
MTIIQSIENFNQAIASIKFYEHYRIETDTPASTSEVAQLEANYRLPIPAELRALYQSLGSVNSAEANESDHINIHSAKSMLEALNHTDRWCKLHTPGLIDYVRYRWSHDRWELDEFIDKEKQSKLNANYQVFGIWRGGDILEGAHYFYFDANGNFGTVYYHQDDFDAFMDALTPMLANSPANQTLEQCIEGALSLMRENLLSE